MTESECHIAAKCTAGCGVGDASGILPAFAALATEACR